MDTKLVNSGCDDDVTTPMVLSVLHTMIAHEESKHEAGAVTCHITFGLNDLLSKVV
jgi:hypothetical protein